MTYLTAAISAETTATAKEQIASAVSSKAEALEIRSDYIASLDEDKLCEVINFAKQTNLPVIATCRDSKQGGQNNLDRQTRIRMACTAIRAGADFIDCEYENFKSSEFSSPIKQTFGDFGNTELILSCHDFEGKFENLPQLYEQIYTIAPNAIAKTAYMAGHINDCFAAFDIIEKYKNKAVVICMGTCGRISRLLAKKLGAFCTFASVDTGSATADGQITLSDMYNCYQYDRINSGTEFYGIIGSPVGHSISPAVHNSCFAAAGLNKVYLPVLLDGGFEEFSEFMTNVLDSSFLSFAGFSVTIPHKSNAISFANHRGEYIEPLAVKIGAANTITIGRNRRMSCYNTDYSGALDALTSAMGIDRKSLKNKTAAVIGAGGVSRAIVAGLTDTGAKVVIYNRTLQKAHRLAQEFNCHYEPFERTTTLDTDIIINCTSIGMYPHIDVSPLPAGVIKPSMTVFDTVYNPAETLFLKQAKTAGAKIVNGLSMFIAQAAEQYKHFTHSSCDMELISKTVYGLFED